VTRRSVGSAVPASRSKQLSFVDFCHNPLRLCVHARLDSSLLPPSNDWHSLFHIPCNTSFTVSSAYSLLSSSEAYGISLTRATAWSLRKYSLSPKLVKLFGIRASKHCSSCTLRLLLTLNLPISSRISLVMLNLSIPW
jgi:hypothetical protein